MRHMETCCFMRLFHTFANTRIYARLKRGSNTSAPNSSSSPHRDTISSYAVKGKKANMVMYLMLSVGRYCELSPQQERQWWWRCGCAWAPECQVALLHSSNSERMTLTPLMISENPASLLHKHINIHTHRIYSTFMLKNKKHESIFVLN